jgi:hypothetical protein
MPLAPAIAVSLLLCLGAWLASRLPKKPDGG